MIEYAYPQPTGAGEIDGRAGMELRDFFAAQAIPAVVNAEVTFSPDQPARADYDVELIARRSYEIADAMMVARRRSEPVDSSS